MLGEPRQKISDGTVDPLVASDMKVHRHAGKVRVIARDHEIEALRLHADHDLDGEESRGLEEPGMHGLAGRSQNVRANTRKDLDEQLVRETIEDATGAGKASHVWRG